MVTDGSKHVRATAAPPLRHINVNKFAGLRASELEALHSIVSNRLNNDFRGARNKRRRTAGHDNQSLKNRGRKKQKVGEGERLERSEKKAPRHVRRRIELKKNPQSGFSTSGDGTKRLRTHVWHAKRFAMSKHWGFHLPLGLLGRGRGSKALLKWLENGAVIHDASYHGAVQLEGPEDSLLSILIAVMVPSPSTDPEEISNKVLSGALFASSMLHHAEAPNTSTIAPVTYMWRPHHQQFRDVHAEAHGNDKCDNPRKVNSFSSLRQVWVWIHAAAFREGYNALKVACQRQCKIDGPGASINCVSLEGQLAKLDVMGSKAFKTLGQILRPATSISGNPSISSEVQNALILENEDQISPRTIISLTVSDPRVLTAKGVGVVPEAVASTGVIPEVITSTGILGQIKRNEDKESDNLAGIAEKDKESGLSLYVQPDECCNVSENMDLWDACRGLCPPLEESVICMEKHQERLATFCLGERSTGQLNTSTKKQFSRFCPTLLLRNSNLKGSITSWSVILPLSWAKAFWVPLVAGGARAIGLREKRWVACEVGLPYFPMDFPDCSAYSSFMATEAAAFDENASLRPTSMRPQHVPIPPPWECVQFALGRNFTGAEDTHFHPSKLCSDKMDCDNSLTNSSRDFDTAALGDRRVVARTSKMLSHLLNDINGDHLLLFPIGPDKKMRISKIMRDVKLINQGPHRFSSLTNDKNPCFLRVRLHAYKEGAFEDGAVVCAPYLTDIKLWTSRLESNNVGIQVPQSSIASYFVQQPSGKWELQVPEDPTAMESHRWPIGFVTTGFVRGSKKPVAEALCEAVLLARLREEQWSAVPSKKRRKEIYVLVRNIRSAAYRLALAHVVLEELLDDLEYM